MENNFVIIRDTREQKGWGFNAKCEIKEKALATGDYTIEGLEDKLCIERKYSVAELAHNIVSDRFTRELERMAKFPYAFLLCEFDMFDINLYPEGCNIPKSKLRSIKVRPAFIMKRISDIQVKYGIHVVFCGAGQQNAQWIALNIMKRVYENETNKLR